MNYMGGKWRQGPAIAKVVEQHFKPGMSYYEPFCGAMGSAFRCIPVVRNMGCKNVVLSDVSASLINMWKAILNGWVPPDVVKPEDHAKCKKERDPLNPMTAYCGFGMSFAGEYFATYARETRNELVNYKRSRNLKISTLAKAEIIRGSKLICCSYEEVHAKNSVIYLDPPYEKRPKRHDYDSFNHNDFWQYTRDLVKNNVVIVTGFNAPPDFVPIYSWGDTVVLHYRNGVGSDGTNERIFMHESQAHMMNSKG